MASGNRYNIVGGGGGGAYNFKYPIFTSLYICMAIATVSSIVDTLVTTIEVKQSKKIVLFIIPFSTLS